ncbi:unnamed protein product [Peniophora sp. CBMAI 1063]|nr:unnamed protein product [Peniophora sp. CBMAI 1063]
MDPVTLITSLLPAEVIPAAHPALLAAPADNNDADDEAMSAAVLASMTLLQSDIRSIFSDRWKTRAEITIEIQERLMIYGVPPSVSINWVNTPAIQAVFEDRELSNRELYTLQMRILARDAETAALREEKRQLKLEREAILEVKRRMEREHRAMHSEFLEQYKVIREDGTFEQLSADERAKLEALAAGSREALGHKA